MRRPLGMALFGMVWLLRVRSEMKRCAKCRREACAQAEKDSQSELERTPASCSTYFTTDIPGMMPPSTETLISTERLAPTTYCEVHGFNPPKEDIQEFYELTLLDENKSVQEKTAETIRIANKWEANDGPITPSYTNNDLVVFTTVLAVTKASVVSGGTAYLQPSISVPVTRTVIAEPHDPNPQYSFGYDVQDPFTGDNHGQVESRSGDVVTGRYSLIDSDGTRRVVDYSADPINGFNALVSREPLAVRAVVAEQPVAPVAVAAPQRVAAVAYGAPQPVLPPAPLARSPVVAEPWAVNVAPVTASLVGSSVRSGPVVADEPWAVSSVAADPWPVSGGFECPY